MTSNIQQCAPEAPPATSSTAPTGFQTFIAQVNGSILWLGRKIDDLTHKFLPAPLARITAIFIKTIPFIALGLTFPNPLFWVGIGSIIVYKIASEVSGHPLGVSNVENGIAIGGIWFGFNTMATGAVLHSIPKVLIGAAAIFGSLLKLLGTGFIFDILGVPPGEL